MIEVQEITKQFVSGDRPLQVLKDVSFTINEGETAAIIGPSGSGKTTLLGICAALDEPTSGIIKLFGTDIHKLTEEERAEFRNEHIGFVFQNFQLISTLTAIENIMVPSELMGDKSALSKAKELLENVGLSDRANHYPSQLSGGEQQRIALARAFITKPKVLFADEPTGNLDAENGANIEQLMFSLNKTFKTTLVIVTHDPDLAAKCNRVVSLKGGVVVANTVKDDAQILEVNN
jgi:putative ABC transport system ATP-binding protein